ncbi:MAG: M28 family peptidase [Candidatus Palauibacterales bacterium]|nr:M28 family peptidase [Candidatus Palauibacterales bacterium]
MRRFVTLIPAALLLLLVSVGPATAQDRASLLDARRRDVLHEALSGEIAKDHVIQITRHHRVQASRGYRDAAEYVLAQLRAYGFSDEDAWIESYPSDGRIEYQTWQSPSGWDIDRAELRMVEPSDERLVGYPEVAMSLITYSNPGDVTAELVWVGAGTAEADYEGKDVAGKFVLATGYGGEVHRHAVLEHGAAAVVAYLDDDRAADHPDMLQYTGMWPRSEELERVTFGFNLSNRQGERLRALLESGQRVVLKGSVEGTGLEPYFLDVVVARIPGSTRPAEELVLSAHLDHPKESANDNASGSGAILDIAVTLHQLIGAGRLEQPERTVRFLWVPEWYGTQAYLDAHPEMAGPPLGGTWLANLNMDMVGENLELLHSRMILTRTPSSIPSALNTVVSEMARMVDGMNVRTPRGSRSAFNWRVTAYSGGSDHMQFIDRKIPGVMIGHSPDYTHHTSDDTPDRVDPVELERAEILAAGTTVYLASLSETEALDLVDAVAAGSLERIGAAARTARQLEDRGAAGADIPPPGEVDNHLTQVAGWEREALESVLYFHDSPPVRQAVERWTSRQRDLEASIRTDLADRPGAVESGSPELRPADERVPLRLTRGPLDFGLPASRLEPEAAAWYSSPDFPLSGDARFELVNFIDGERSVSGIRNALSAEFGPIATADVARYLEDLVAAGVVRWAPSR